MEALASWLSHHGLEKYIDVFNENDLTLDLLPDLDQNDLRELGLSLGHRKRFFKAIGDSPEGLVDTAPTSDSPPLPEIHSERRLLTLMFCDLVDSTAIGRNIGAENMQDLLRDYQEMCVTAVNRYGGYVARYLGDGILVYFGYPQAHEQDAERAIRAGLHIIEQTKTLDADYQARYQIDIRVRIGVATGHVVVGDIIGSGASTENAVVGDAANLAARIQSLAPLNTVTVSPTTRKLCQYAFQFSDHGAHLIKGIAEPVQIWRVAGEQQQTSRFRATRPDGAATLIGRDEELQVLITRWQSVQHAEGHIVEVKGEAGIGKSHLIESFLAQSNITDANSVLFQCSPYHTGSVLQPVLQQLQNTANVSNSTLFTNDALTLFFNEASVHQNEAIHYFGQQLGLPAINADQFKNVLPQTLRQHAFSAWVENLLSRAKEAATVIIIEDAHWLDATSIELFTQLINRLHDYPVLLIITARPEFNTPWKNHRCLATPMTLNRMQRAQGIAIIEKVASPVAMPTHVIDTILEKTDGVPLFVEELTKSIIESGVINQSNPGSSNAAFQIPETLHDLLMSRIDQNPSIRNILQIGAAIGRDFAFQILASVTSQEDAELQKAIDAVVESEVVFESGVLPTSVYTFRHALIQDAAYQSLLKKNRRVLHAKIAETLEAENHHTPSDEQLAYHWSKAGNHHKAVEYWHKAARYATSIWANGEAVKRYNNALAELSDIESPQRNEQLELTLLLELGDALRAASGSSASDTISAFSKATKLCAKFNDTDLYVRASYGEFTAYFTSAKLKLARSVAEALLSRAKVEDNQTGIVAGHQAIGMCDFATGNFASAKQEFELALQSVNAIDNKFDIQFPVLSQCYLSWTLYLTGNPQEALALSQRAIEESEAVSTYNRALAMTNACYLHQFGRDTVALAQLTNELKIYSIEKGFPVWHAVAEFFDQWQQCQTDKSTEALDKLLQALDFWRADEIEIPYFKSIVAETLTDTPKNAIAKRLQQEAQTLMDDTGEVWYRHWQNQQQNT